MNNGVNRQQELPADELAFRWRGGRPVLDFTATVGERWQRGFERLRSPEDLARWLRDAGLADDPPHVTGVDLSAAHELREALYSAFQAARSGRPVAVADLAAINRWSALPARGPRLEDVGGRLHQRPPAEDAAGLLTLLARDGVDLLGGPLAGRIRECARDDCALLFVDESRAGTRRWCSMDDCGARSKMSAYRARRARDER